jgi:chromosome segregation ATPase
MNDLFNAWIRAAQTAAAAMRLARHVEAVTYGNDRKCRQLERALAWTQRRQERQSEQMEVMQRQIRDLQSRLMLRDEAIRTPSRN